MSYDIVIPVGPSDEVIFLKSIVLTLNNVKNYRNIYIVSKKTYDIPGCIFVSEDTFPFSVEDIGSRLGCRERAGWYVQQLIKLTAGTYIKGILDHYLVLDADVFVLKPLEFMLNGIPLYAHGDEYHIPYFEHMVKLHPSFKRERQDVSGICHHMMFYKPYVQQLFDMVEDYTNKPFTDAFLDAVTLIGPGLSGASEYELYFNYMIRYHPNDMIIRQLKWRNIRSLQHHNENDDYVAIHHYYRDD